MSVWLTEHPRLLQVKGKWSDTETEYGYDFWYQPRHNVMVSSQWGAPAAFRKVAPLHQCVQVLFHRTCGCVGLPLLHCACVHSCSVCD